MEYRILPHGGEKISVIGLGMGSIHNSSEEEIVRIVDRAIGAGINYFDMVASESVGYPAYAKAFEGRRSKVITQIHFGADYSTGKYGWTLDLDVIRKNVEWFKTMCGGYGDFGFIHCIDEMADLEEVMKPNGILDYIESQKEDGAVRHIGFSSHNPEIARRLIDTGLIDLFMFSINPAYDYKKGDYGIGEAEQRAKLYRDCEKAGVGISVMKPFGGGQLLDAVTSPFGRALTKYQCIRYALDRPAVLTVLPGVRNMQDLEEVLGYFSSPEMDKDYAVIGEFTPQSEYGRCVYCNHCQPCPSDLNVGLINKYYDLARAGDQMAEKHYRNLDIHAKDCNQCGHCEERCPFQVKQMERMEEIRKYFGC